MIKLVLPIPDKTLNPNVIKHYHQKAKVKANAKTASFWIVKQQVTSHDLTAEDRLSVSYIYYRADKRLVDLDNVVASCKSLQDGVFQALGLNDNQIDHPSIVRGGVDKANPRIEMVIERR